MSPFAFLFSFVLRVFRSPLPTIKQFLTMLSSARILNVSNTSNMPFDFSHRPTKQTLIALYLCFVEIDKYPFFISFLFKHGFSISKIFFDFFDENDTIVNIFFCLFKIHL